MITTDEETDRKGNVFIFFKIKDTSFNKCGRPLRGWLFCMRMLSDFPIRNDAFHKFLGRDENIMHRVVDYGLGMLHPDFVARSRVHYGTHKDWMDELMSFGVPHDVVPFTSTHKTKLKNHQEYLAMRIKAEEMRAEDPTLTPESLIDLPTRSDVLLGKGKPIQFSSGNQRLMTIIDAHLDEYNDQPSNIEKTALTQEIVRMVKASGVRFLSKDNGIWMEVPGDVARDKVAHMFRYQRRKVESTSGHGTRVVRDVPSAGSIPDLVANGQAKIRKLSPQRQHDRPPIA